MKSLQQMQAEVIQVNKDKGWYDQPVSFLEAMALLHTEVSEAVQAWRIHGVDATKPRSCSDPQHSDSTWDHECTDGSPGKPEGVGSEFADVLIRLLSWCDRFGIDLAYEYERKMAYNQTRPYRHGGKRA